MEKAKVKFPFNKIKNSTEFKQITSRSNYYY